MTTAAATTTAATYTNPAIAMAIRNGATVRSQRAHYKRVALQLQGDYGLSNAKINRAAAVWRDRCYDDHDGSPLQVACSWALAIGLVLADQQYDDPRLS